MAKFKFPPLASVFTTAAGDDAFEIIPARVSSEPAGRPAGRSLRATWTATWRRISQSRLPIQVTWLRSAHRKQWISCF